MAPLHTPRRRHWAAAPSVLLAAAAAMASLAAAPAAAAPPRFLSQPRPQVAAAVGDAITLNVRTSPPPGDGGTAIQWQTRQSAPFSTWRDVPGATGATYTASVACPTFGLTDVYRAVACNADGCTPSAASAWDSVTLRAPVWVTLPPARVPAGANLTFTAAAPAASLIIVGVREADGEGGSRVSGLDLVRPIVPGQSGVVLRGALAGGVYWGVATAVCGGSRGISSATVRSPDVVVGRPAAGAGLVAPLTAVCPPWVKAVAADYDGYVLNNGDVFSTPTCGACRSACAGTPGCDTWVWGADATNAARRRQCWLKKAFPGPAPVVKPYPGAPARRSPWVSGTLPAPRRCPGWFSADYNGRVLVRGDTNPRPTCTTCAAACRANPRCNVWVWGFKGIGSGRHRECWLKVWEGGGRPTVKAGSWTRTSEWLGGVLEDRL